MTSSFKNEVSNSTFTSLEPYTVRFLRSCFGDSENDGVYLILDKKEDNAWRYLVLVEDEDDDNERAGQVHSMQADWLVEYTEPYEST